MFFVIGVTFFLVLGGLTALWIWGLLHCRNNPRLSQNSMEQWLIFIALVPVVGVAAYFYKHRHDPVDFKRPVGR
jgi:uncharacterized membrane protein YhaH (DUF805 family)